MTKPKPRVTEKKLAAKLDSTKGKKKTKTQGVTTAKAVVAKVAKPETIGGFTKACILAGDAVKDIEAKIKAKFPHAREQLNSIYYYRSQLHKSGELAKA